VNLLGGEYIESPTIGTELSYSDYIFNLSNCNLGFVGGGWEITIWRLREAIWHMTGNWGTILNTPTCYKDI
jgi:hypothetical protein